MNEERSLHRLYEYLDAVIPKFDDLGEYELSVEEAQKVMNLFQEHYNLSPESIKIIKTKPKYVNIYILAPKPDKKLEFMFTIKK